MEADGGPRDRFLSLLSFTVVLIQAILIFVVSPVLNEDFQAIWK